MPAASPTPRDVGRAAAWGLLAGLLLGGVALLGLALRALLLGPDCTGLPPAECALRADTAREMARLQALAGSALCLLALALRLWLRAPRPDAS